MRATVENESSQCWINGLRVDFIDRPIGLDNAIPSFSWALNSKRPGTRQTAYKVLVATTPEQLTNEAADLWNSGRVDQPHCSGIQYGGRPLLSRQTCYWTVSVWDENCGQVSASEPSSWEMGLLSPRDWQARWVSAEDDLAAAARLAGMAWIWGDDRSASYRFRRRLNVANNGSDLTIHVLSVTGIKSISVNGEPVFRSLSRGDINLTTDRPMSVVHRLLRGPNVIEIVAEEKGFVPWRTPALCAALFVRDPVGRSQCYPSNRAWSTLQDDAPTDRAWRPARVVREAEPAHICEPAVRLRKRFALSAGILRARLYATALGYFTIQINGEKVGDAVLEPTWSDFRKRILYRSCDVTNLVRPGTNAIAAEVGNGWYAGRNLISGGYAYGPPPKRFLAQLEVTYRDGSIERVCTDHDWRMNIGPISENSIYDGEVYDSPSAEIGWDLPEFADDHWPEAVLASDPTAPLVADIVPPVRRIQVFPSKSVHRIGSTSFVHDFGQNFSGWCRLRIQGAKRGDEIEIIFAEVVRADGTVNVSNLRSANARSVYRCSGAEQEIYEPQFTYFGFRYAQVTGTFDLTDKVTVEGIALSSDLAPTGELNIDHPLIRQLANNTYWSQRSNFMGVPTDCPQRDERLAWSGDAAAFWDAAAFFFDIAGFTARFLGDIRDAQGADGAFADVSPNPGPNPTVYGSGATPGWADAGVILPWTIWQRYGDVQIIKQNWSAMMRYVQFILDHNPDYLWRTGRGSDFGDWLSLDAKSASDPTTPKDLVATAFWANSAAKLAEMAEAVGAGEDCRTLSAQHKNIVAAFQKDFVRADGTIGNASQTAQILALRFDLVPDELRARALEVLVSDIARRGGILSTGFLGTPHALDVLADGGHSRLVYDLLLRTEPPSWGHMIQQGATTIWERWDGDTSDDMVHCSFNHYALGAVCGFVFRRIAGIEAAEPGFSRIRVSPVLDPRIQQGGAQFRSVRGLIATKWIWDGDEVRLDVTVPCNATAEVWLPGAHRREVGPGFHQFTGMAG